MLFIVGGVFRKSIQHCGVLSSGKVYNISPYLEYHPGGVEELMRGAGVDGTQLFDEVTITSVMHNVWPVG